MYHPTQKTSQSAPSSRSKSLRISSRKSCSLLKANQAPEHAQTESLDNDGDSNYNKNTSRLSQVDVPTNPEISQSPSSSRSKSLRISSRKSCSLLKANQAPEPVQTESLDEKHRGIHEARRSKRLQPSSKSKVDSMKPQDTEAGSSDGKIGIPAEHALVTRSKRLDLMSSNNSEVHSLKGNDVKEKNTPCLISKMEHCKDDIASHIAIHTTIDKKHQPDSVQNVLTYNSSMATFQTAENIPKHRTKDLKGEGMNLENSISKIEQPKRKKIKRLPSKKKTHTCKHCNLPFTTLTLLNKHSKTCHNLNRVRFRRKQGQFLVNNKCNENLSDDEKQAKSFQCTECNLELKNEILLCKHLLKIHNVCQFSCKHCSKVFSRKDSLLSHRLTHLRVVTTADGSRGVVTIPEQTDRIFKCDKCSCEFHKWDSFKKHTKMRHGDDAVCDVCCTTHGSHEALNAHMAGHDWNKMDELESLHECDVCHRLFLTPFKLNRHMVSNITSLFLGYSLSGYCIPNLELTCFVCYLKIVNTFMKNNVCIL